MKVEKRYQQILLRVVKNTWMITAVPCYAYLWKMKEIFSGDKHVRPAYMKLVL